MTTEPSTELALTPAWTKIKNKSLAALPSAMAREGDRFFQIAYGLIREDKGLTKCSELSLCLAVYTCARLGLIPDPVSNHVHIIPFAGKATVIVGVKGYIELAHRHPKFRGLFCPPTIVYQNDEFDCLSGTTMRIVHRSYRMAGHDDSGHPIASYLVANIDGTKQPEIMWADEIEKIKKNVHAVRQNKQTPWTTDHYTEMEMWKKTVVRRAAKRWPQRSELGLASALDDAVDLGHPMTTVVHLPRDPSLPEGEGRLTPATGEEAEVVDFTNEDIEAGLGDGS